MNNTLRFLLLVPLFGILVSFVYVLISLLRLLKELERQQAEYRRVREQANGENHDDAGQSDKLVGLPFHLRRRLGLFFRKQREQFRHVRHLDAHAIGMTDRLHACQEVGDSLIHNSSSPNTVHEARAIASRAPCSGSQEVARG